MHVDGNHAKKKTNAVDNILQCTCNKLAKVKQNLFNLMQPQKADANL